MSMQIKTIALKDTLALRHSVLWPNKPIEFCLVEGDESASHYGIYIEKKLVGVASTYDNSGIVRLRKFAVTQENQGQGLGTALLTHVIDAVRNTGATEFWCDARTTTVDFYKRFGLHIVGNQFFKSEISYYKMSLSF